MVRWDEIVEQCGNYKAGFVAIFRRYEGQPTDETDKQGRAVKVTAKSFADHMGIPDTTFRRWLASVVTNPVTTEAQRATGAAGRAVRKLAETDPGAVVDAILSAGIGASDQVFHEHKLRRAGVDTSRAGRKAAEAEAHQRAAPFRHALASAAAPLCAAAIREATEHLRNMIAEGALNDETMADISAANEEWQITLAEARYSVS